MALPHNQITRRMAEAAIKEWLDSGEIFKDFPAYCIPIIPPGQEDEALLTINEARHTVGLGPIDDGDTLLASPLLIAASCTPPGQEEEEAPKPKADQGYSRDGWADKRIGRVGGPPRPAQKKSLFTPEPVASSDQNSSDEAVHRAIAQQRR